MSARRAPSLLAVALLLSVATLSLGWPTAAGGATPTGASPSRAYCDALADFYELSLVVQLAAEIAAASGDAGEQTASVVDEIRATYLVVLSPKLNVVARALSRGGPRALNRAFRRQRDVFAFGTQLLAEAGLSETQIDALRATEPATVEADLQRLLAEAGATDADVALAASKLLPVLEQLEVGIDQRVTDAFDRVGTECGVVSETIDCERVFSRDDADEVLGIATEQDGAGCDYEAVGAADALAPEVAVEVYASGAAFRRISAGIDGEAVDGVGDRAVAFAGFSAYAGVKSCGRTLVARDGDRTVVVALCLAGDAPVTNDQLRDLAERTLERLDR